MKKNKQYLIVEADVNDADYISERSEIDEEALAELMPIIKKIKACKKRHNWEDPQKYLSNKEIDTFSEYMPSMDNQDVHTIVGVDLVEVCSEKSLL